MGKPSIENPDKLVIDIGGAAAEKLSVRLNDCGLVIIAEANDGRGVVALGTNQARILSQFISRALAKGEPSPLLSLKNRKGGQDGNES